MSESEFVNSLHVNQRKAYWKLKANAHREGMSHVIELVKDWVSPERYEYLKKDVLGAANQKQCTCGEPHISRRVVHRYDGKPCYVSDVPDKEKDSE